MSREFALKPPKPRKLPEAKVTELICEFLRNRRWTLIRLHVGTFIPKAIVHDAISAIYANRWEDARALLNRHTISMNKEGTTDYLAVHPVLHPPIWVEMKASGKHTRPNQVVFLEHMTEVEGYLGGYWNDYDAFVSWYLDQFPAERSWPAAV